MRASIQPANAYTHPLDMAATSGERRTAWRRLCGFLALGIGLTLIALFVIKHVLKVQVDLDALSMRVLLVAQALQAVVMVVVPTAVLLRAGREPATCFGWGRSHRLRQLGIGVAVGAGMMILLLAILALLGVFSLGSPLLSARDALVHGLGYAAVFALTAIAEEGFLRGYALVQLSRAISFWPAAAVTSVVFAALHLTHATETPMAIVQAGMVGLVLAYSFRRSGGLWFACGFHAAWDFVQTYLAGVADSGMSASDVLMHSSFHGPAWLTGGSAGPEGSAIALPLTVLAGVVTHLVLKPRDA
ncbi:CPBP family intramembrane glutamic endopeptidase [Dyella acidiphila]|uniref:CPBP family intramembrane metalloprotease n=1 Tax=Dyella acidiphila TaxID=2775866 RepID=A0ABR9GEB3_9GAMM|nr:CPBP family intramembrane glutamic endopeptidase [Dyella acidiphila]MBE1162385.1 CPBP family intramembrane metalloprotease [Dyella acidiphila]